jgi:hypothetical protein
MNGPWRGIREKSMRASILCFAFLMTGASHLMGGQDYYPSPSSLKGLKGVFVQVSAVSGLVSVDRSLRQTMEELTEQYLRGAGVNVLSRKDWERSPDAARIQLDIFVTCERDEVSCGYSVVLNLGQHVQLTRGSDIITGTTWSNSYTGSIGKAELTVLPVPDRMAVDARTLLLDFIGDFRKANPQ